MKVTEVLAQVYEPGRLRAAWQQVKKNAGAAGIDWMTVEEFGRREENLLALIHDQLKSGSYRFKPARRVEIPKEGSSKKRKLGVPVVMDRIVGVSMHLVLEAIFDSDFTESNFGFRRGKSQHQAIRHLQGLVKEGREWAVAVDLKSFFDEIPHGLILKLIRRKVADERIVILVARLLKAGVIVNGNFEKTTKGCAQGSPLSPLLSNIVLNELDHELEERNLGYARWADDFVIVVRSERAARRVMKGTIQFLDEALGLAVNEEKSRVAPLKEITFVGFQILRGKLRVSNRARLRFKERVRGLTRRNNPLSMYQVIDELSEYLRGWVGYFGVQEFKYLFRNLDAWIRSRLRSTQFGPDGNLVGEGDCYAQAIRVYQNVAAVLALEGASMADIVKTTTWLPDMTLYQDYARARAETFPGAIPCSTTVGSALVLPELLIEIEAVAIIGSGGSG